MKIRNTFIYLFIVTLIVKAFTNSVDLTCIDVIISRIGQVFYYLQSNIGQYVNVEIFLSTRSATNQVKLDVDSWSAIRSAGFNPLRKTVLIVHGYASDSKHQWVTKMTRSILYNINANVIAVDWSKGNSSWNYVNMARNTPRASRKIVEFLQIIKSYKGANVTGHMWNHLYFIGHSLGAHVSGQAAHLLKQDNFWKIERITGLDPAQPCFVAVNSSLKIDKMHADFVDIIHTQAGKRDNNQAFGLHAVLGHVDFYVNGGLLQPACGNPYATISSQICSHSFATEYFSEALYDEVAGICSFDSAAWNGTYADAERLLELKKNGDICQQCPEMGIEASKSSARGKFIVFTSSSLPYCELNSNDYDKIKRILKNLQEKN